MEICMNQPSLKELEEKYEQAIKLQKDIENRLEHTQTEIDRLSTLFDSDLKALKDAQHNTNILKEQIFEVKKHNFKEMLNGEGIKKAFGGAIPFFSKLKEAVSNKTKEVKEYIDGTSINRQWVEEVYEDYKKICIEKGEEIKSKEEFQKIALALKEVDDEVSELNLYKILGKAAKEVGQAKDSFKNVWISLGVEDKIQKLLQQKKNSHQDEAMNDSEVIEEKLDKKTVLAFWISEHNIVQDVRAKTAIQDLYDNYQFFISAAYGHEKVEELAYSIKNGGFVSALNRHFEGLTQNKENKTIGLKIKA